MRKKPPFLDFQKIDKIVQTFFSNNKQYDKVPVPIENIVEDLGYEIIPIPDLKRELDAEGFVVLKEIYIDQYIHDQPSPNRYYSTLAHEAGHIFLHTDYMSKFKTKDDYIEFMTTFDEESYQRIEWQAWSFARLLLMPSNHFSKELSRLITQKGLKGQGNDYIADMLKLPISRKFEVSDLLANIRIRNYFEYGI